jgi:hypothetical protein
MFQNKTFIDKRIRYLLLFIIVASIAILPIKTSAQSNLGTAIGFSLFTASGAVGNTTVSTVSGDVGTNLGAFIAPTIFTGNTQVVNKATYDDFFATPATITTHAATFGQVGGRTTDTSDTLDFTPSFSLTSLNIFSK